MEIGFEALIREPSWWEPWLRLGLPMLAALVAAAVCDLLAVRNERPPGFAVPWRRAAAAALLGGLFYVGVFAPLGTIGQAVELDLTGTAPWELFTLHALLAAVMLVWGLLAYARQRDRAESLGRRLAVAFRLVTPRPLHEIGLGLGAGIAIWGGVLVVLMAIAAAILALGGEAILPAGPPGVITFLVAQPLWLRLAAALSAGFVEETFFRGFLQPRIGIVFSTVLFALAHWSYGEPFMLVGVTILSVVYGLLARRRGNVWAAATAHAVFDAVQLLVVVPWVVEQFGGADTSVLTQ
jgi:membrane protease YdiL (CAAX protease family)